MDAHQLLKLETAIIKHDKAQMKGKSYNRYALPQYLDALAHVREAVNSGTPLDKAIKEYFCGRLEEKLLRAISQGENNV